ncbi:retention module-containing protein, partial [Laribacter hongkongensis]|uniref:retention module-containing protein n=2 Tax=Laribacter hongkongensis TaxID=168471 RepID=UPI001EFDDEE4
MAAQGQIVEVQGVVKAIAADGRTRILKSGDIVQAGERVELADGASVLMMRPDGEMVALDGGRTVLLSEEMLIPRSVDATDAKVEPLNAEAEQVIAALTNNADPFNTLEEAAAGLTGGGPDGGFSAYRLGRIVESISPLQMNGATADAMQGDVRVSGLQVATLNNGVTLQTVDTTAPDLGINLNPVAVGGDNVVNKAEADGKAGVALTGTVSGDAKAGDTVTLTLGDGSKLTTPVVMLGNGQLGFSTTTTADKLVGGTSVKAEITVTDEAGNSTTREDTESYTVDTTAPDLGINLNPVAVGGDNVVNKAEADGKAG